LKSNFYSQVNAALCKGTCPECIKVCPAKAVTLNKKSKKAQTRKTKCIGCGLCVGACPEKALTLVRKENPYQYPDTWDDYLRTRSLQTGRKDFYQE
jgi:ferredoxin